VGWLAWIENVLGPRKGPPVDPVDPVHPVGPFDPVKESARAVELMNAQRRALSRAPYATSPTLQKVSDGHAALEAARGVMSHQEIGEPAMEDRLTRAGYRWRACAEDVAAGQADAATVVADWMASPPHRQNILGPYKDCAVSVSVSPRGTKYWAAVFATPA
jgi:uncharacterized protein YkwD